MKIGYVQTSPVHGAVARNLERARALIDDAPQSDLLVLPELFATGYQHASREALAFLAEDAEGPTITWAKELSITSRAALCGGFAFADAGKIYNAAFLVDGGSLVSIYCKAHLFNKEKLVFDPGPGPFEAHAIRGVEVGMMICFDWQFPETARALALSGARILLHPSNLVLPYAQEAMKTRCLENGVFAVTANRVGAEGDLRFTGKSQATGTRGDVLMRAGALEECVGVVEIDPAEAGNKRITAFNDRFGDRRPELYGRISSPNKRTEQ